MLSCAVVVAKPSVSASGWSASTLGAARPTTSQGSSLAELPWRHGASAASPSRRSRSPPRPHRCTPRAPRRGPTSDPTTGATVQSRAPLSTKRGRRRRWWAARTDPSRRSGPCQRKCGRCRRCCRRISRPVFFVGNFALALCARGDRRGAISKISRDGSGSPLGEWGRPDDRESNSRIGDLLTQVGWLGTDWTANDPQVKWMKRLDAAGILPRFQGLHRLTENTREHTHIINFDFPGRHDDPLDDIARRITGEVSGSG